jgi:MFS family permease
LAGLTVERAVQPVVARRRLDTFGALQRHPNCRLYWTGALLSNIGTWMQTLAQSWLVYDLTGSALLLGTVTFLQGVPALFLSLLGGVLADRVERRTLMLVTQTAQMLLAFLLAGLTLAHVVRVEHVMAIAFLSGLVNAINSPCARASSPIWFPRATSKTPSRSAPRSSRPVSCWDRPSPVWSSRRRAPVGRSC